MLSDTVLSRDAFLLGMELKLFWAIAFIYGFSALLFLIHSVSGEGSVGRIARALLTFNIIIHTGLIVLRTFEAGRAPFETLYESLSWFAWSASATYIIVTRRWRDVYLPGLFVSSLSLGACLYSLLSRSPGITILPPALQSYWFEWHVVFAFFSYAVFIVSASVEASFLILNPFVKRGVGRAWGLGAENIEEFHSLAKRLVMFGYPFLTFAILSGAAWANEAWGRYWSWDPKETWSLVTWTVFTIYLHSKAIPKYRGLPASVINIIGFVCMMMTFLGVNWLAKLLGIPSLHVYTV